MTARVPPIKEFPHDGRTWRIDWFGAVERNASVPTEPTIEVVASPLKPDAKDPASNGAVVHEERQTIRIGIGQFPAIAVGSLWKNGRCLPTLAGRIETFRNLSISPQTTRLIATDHAEHGEPLIPSGYHKVGGKGLSAKCLAVTWKNDPFGIVIPIAEIIRFYYATSTDLAHALFAGDFRHNLLSIIDPEKSGYLAASRRCVLRLRQEFADEDGWLIGRILNSTEAFQGAATVHDSLMRESANRYRAYPECAFPFSGNTTLQAHCKPVKSLGKWRYLVFSLARCSGQFPFDELEIVRENDGRTAAPETDIPDEEKQTAFPGKQSNLAASDKAREIQSGTEPSKNIEVSRFALPSERFGAIAGKKPIKPDKEQCRYKSGALGRFEGAELMAFGTGQGTYGETDSAPAKIVTEKTRSRALPASFDNLLAAIELLDGYSGAKASIREPDDTIESMPLLKPRKYRQWSYLDSERKTPRRVVVADILAEGRNFCLIEFEWREKEHGFKVGLVCLPDGSVIGNHQLYKLLLRLAREEGRWDNIPNPPCGMRLRTLKHTWSTVQDYAKAVREKIKSFVAAN